MTTENMTLPTGDVVGVGSTVSACVKRTGRRQMFWYAGQITGFKEGRAVVALDHYPNECAYLGPRNIRCRTVTPNVKVSGGTERSGGTSARPPG